MNSVKKTLSQDVTSAIILTFSDWHIGDAFCDINAIRAQVESAKAPNTYVILDGDLVNNATKGSVSDSYAESMSPMEQIKQLMELLMPIRDKILIVTSGNHENRTYKDDGIDITRLVCRQLGIEDRYCREGGVLFLRLGTNKRQGTNRQQCYSFYVTHGSGGGRKEGSKAVRLADMASIIDVDIYIHGHTHLPMIMKQGFYRASFNTSSVEMVTKLFVNTAASLNYGGYGQSYEFKPASTHNPVIYISGERKEFTARL